MNFHLDSNKEFDTEFDGHPMNNVDDVVVDTRLADTLEWIAKRASQYALRSGDPDSDNFLECEDLRYVIGTAAAAGEISAEHVTAALADTLQALCVVAGDDSMAEFMRDWVGTTFASVVRLDSPVRVHAQSEAKFPRFETEPPDDDTEVTELKVTAEAAHRIGAMIHNLRREPVGVTASESSNVDGTLTEEWTIGAALNAVTHGWEDADDVSGYEIALMISLPILVITELFDWLDARVIEGLSRSALEFLKTELVPSLLKHFSDEEQEAA